MGLTSLVGRLGGSLAPLAALLDGVWLSLPDIAYGGIALLAACTAFLLPETRRAKLPETIQDVERTRCVHRAGSVCACMQVLGNLIPPQVYLGKCVGVHRHVQALRYGIYDVMHTQIPGAAQERALSHACTSGQCTGVCEHHGGSSVCVPGVG